VKTIWLKSTGSGATDFAAPAPRTAASRTLVSNGRWVVPPEARPAGWQNLHVSEPREDRPAADTEAFLAEAVAR